MDERKLYQPPRLTFLGTERPTGFPELAELVGPGDDDGDDDDDEDDEPS